jgi:hypothetical protein
MTPAEKNVRRHQHWARYSGVALMALSLFATFHVGWLSLPQVPSNLKALGELPPSSLRDFGLFILSLAFPTALLILTFWVDVHFRLQALHSLIESRSGASGGEVIQAGDWDHAKLLSMLKEAKPRQLVKIWTTFFVNDAQELGVIRALAASDVRFNILVMNPNNDPLLRSRYRVRVDFTDNPPVKAKQRILGVVEALNGIAGVRVELCDNMPFGMFYQIGDQVMLVGLPMSGDSWEKGPLMKWYPESRQWKVFEKHWQIVWDNPSDQAQTAPPPPATSIP